MNRVPVSEHLDSAKPQKTEDLRAVLSAIWPKYQERSVLKSKTVLRRGLSLSDRYLRDGLCGRNLCLPDGAQFFIGGAGVIIECCERDSLSMKYALKIPRPSCIIHSDFPNEEAAKAKKETYTHLPLAHRNIARNLGYDTVNLRAARSDNLETTFQAAANLIEWIEDARSIQDYLRTCGSPMEIVRVLKDACDALGYLHSNGFVHWDVKGDNLMVDSSGEVKLMDLGNTAHIAQSPGTLYHQDECRQSTRDNLPPLLKSRVSEPSSTTDHPVSDNRLNVPLNQGEKSWDEPWLDLFMLATEFQRALSQRMIPSDSTEDSEFQLSFIKEVLRRMMVAESPDSPKYYAAAEDVVRVLRRLENEFGEGSGVPELRAIPQHIVRLPPGHNVPWTPRVEALVATRLFSHMKEHLQLATSIHVFPGAHHTRWEHSLGTMEQTLQIVRALFADQSSIYFRLETSDLDIEALILASLLHDIGHPAFGHQVEEAVVVPEEMHHEKYLLDLLERLATNPDSPIPDEEEDELRVVLRTKWGPNVSALLHRVKGILGATAETSEIDPVKRSQDLHDQILKAIITGQMDADKRDYLLRDCQHCGVPYAKGIDIERLDQVLSTCAVNNNSLYHASLCVSEKGTLPLESLIVARYQMYEAVYWHHTVRAMTAMLQRLVELYSANVISHRLAARPPRVDQDRVKRLLTEFRRLPDEKALSWLCEEILNSHGTTRELRKEVEHLRRGIEGERPHLFWCLTEFQGDYNFHSGIYKRLLDEWSPQQSTDEILLKRRNFLLSLRKELVSLCNEEISQSVRPLALAEVTSNSIILDVPVAEKDQVEDLWVRCEGHAVPLEEVTPLARAVATAFQISVRKVRVFVSPVLAKRLISCRGSEDGASQAMRKAVSLAVDNVWQDALPFAE